MQRVSKKACAQDIVFKTNFNRKYQDDTVRSLLCKEFNPGKFIWTCVSILIIAEMLLLMYRAIRWNAVHTILTLCTERVAYDATHCTVSLNPIQR